MTKSIGFVDYYISEWHANNYPAWFKQACLELGYAYEVTYAWAEQAVSPVDGVSTDQWCANMGVTRCDTIQELCQKSDAIVILAPSNPEKHIEYAKAVLPFGKPTYMDKPFSDSAGDAKEIFNLAERYATPFFSSSALRYATELDTVDACTAITTFGGGSNLEEYIIHQAEMVVKKMGLGAKAVKAEEIGKCQYFFTIQYADARRAGMHFVKGGVPFVVTMSSGGSADAVYTTIGSDFFGFLIKDMRRFFETKVPSFDTQQTMEVNRIMVSAIKAKNVPGEWVPM